MKQTDIFPDDEEEGQGGQGGQTGKIHFRYKDVMSLDPRDDLLSPEQLTHLQNVHPSSHKGLVDKQREARKERSAAKNGQTYTSTHTGLRAGHNANPFKEHWSNQLAKNSGKDKQVTNIPKENEANTNDKLKEELQNRLENRLRLKNQPVFHPKPQMR